MLAVNEGKMLTHNDENKTNRALSHKKSKIWKEAYRRV